MERVSTRSDTNELELNLTGESLKARKRFCGLIRIVRWFALSRLNRRTDLAHRLAKFWLQVERVGAQAEREEASQ